MEMTGGPNALTKPERKLLCMMEEEIAMAERAGSRAGWSYREVRDRRLYRESYSRFEDYCEQKWGHSKTHVNRLIWHADLSDWLTERGLDAPVFEKQSRALKRFHERKGNEFDEEAIRAIAGRVAEAGGWKSTSSPAVEQIAEDVSPKTSTDVVPIENRGLVLVTKDGRAVPSARAKARILRGLQIIADEANAIQALGPYAVPDALRVMTEFESNEARRAVAATYRLLVRFSDAWAAERPDQPEDGQQALPVAA